jgi:hypothetical protein
VVDRAQVHEARRRQHQSFHVHGITTVKTIVYFLWVCLLSRKQSLNFVCLLTLKKTDISYLYITVVQQ